MSTPVVVAFAPSPLLTVTIEDRAGEPDIHVHAGGRGVARTMDTAPARWVDPFWPTERGEGVR